MLYIILILMCFDHRLSPYRDLDFTNQLNTVLFIFDFFIWISYRRKRCMVTQSALIDWLFYSRLIEIDIVYFKIYFHGLLGGRFGAASPHNGDCILSSQLYAARIELRRHKHHLLLVQSIGVPRYQQWRLAVVRHWRPPALLRLVLIIFP